ncbi:MAG: hypothetical protein NW223_16180 [Hyphomicrobiaceae bacterium]|nr:hypothetical protein [Hyphomicrobiaceae bacterium]
MRKAATILKVLAVFALAGPPIGGLTVFAGIAAVAAVESVDLAGLARIPLFGLGYGLQLSYMVGTGPALTAGLIIAAWGVGVRPPGLLVALATGAAVGLGLYSLYEQSTRYALRHGSFLLLLLGAPCLLSTLACWALTRPLLRAQTGRIS